MSNGFIYVVENGSGLFKIGFTNDPRRRLTMLRTSSPDRLTMLGVVPATMSDEKEVHRLLEPWRVAREWFRPCRAMQPLIDGLVALADNGRDWQVPADAHPLKAWRISRKLTGTQAAALVGSSKPEWSRWEKGRPIAGPRVLEFEALTGISRHILRPDIYGPAEVAA